MGAQHCNIKNVNYGLMQKMIEYTFENLEKNTRVYDLSRIGQIIQNLSVQDLQIFLENGQKYNKSNTSFKDTIKNKYFSGKKNKLWKLSD